MPTYEVVFERHLTAVGAFEITAATPAEAAAQAARLIAQVRWAVDIRLVAQARTPLPTPVDWTPDPTDDTLGRVQVQPADSPGSGPVPARTQTGPLTIISTYQQLIIHEPRGPAARCRRLAVALLPRHYIHVTALRRTRTPRTRRTASGKGVIVEGNRGGSHTPRHVG
jgi:hypothetical protein